LSKLIEDRREGLLALAVGAGLQGLAATMEEDVTAAPLRGDGLCMFAFRRERVNSDICPGPRAFVGNVGGRNRRSDHRGLVGERGQRGRGYEL
jgi:hypothetical protein